MLRTTHAAREREVWCVVRHLALPCRARRRHMKTTGDESVPKIRCVDCIVGKQSILLLIFGLGQLCESCPRILVEITPNGQLWDINTTLGLATFPRHVMVWSGGRTSSFRAFNLCARVFLRHFRHLAMPYWWALRRAKQLSTAATLLCWSSTSVVLMSCKIKSLYVVRSALLLCLSFKFYCQSTDRENMSLLVVKRPYHAYSQLLFQVVQNSSSSQIQLLNRYSVKQFCKITIHQDEVQDFHKFEGKLFKSVSKLVIVLDMLKTVITYTELFP